MSDSPVALNFIIQPAPPWNSIANLARTQNAELLNTLQAGFKYIETESFESTFQGLFSEIDLSSPKLGKKYEDRNAKFCTIIQKIAEGLAEFSTDIDALGDAYESLIGQFAAHLSAWGHRFTRLFTVVRAAMWERLELLGVLRSHGTASGSCRVPGAAHAAWLPGLEPATG